MTPEQRSARQVEEDARITRIRARIAAQPPEQVAANRSLARRVFGDGLRGPL